MLKSSDGTTGWMLPFRKWVHAFTLPLLLDMAITSLTTLNSDFPISHLVGPWSSWLS